MSWVLAIDTAGPEVGVALRVGGEVRRRVQRIARGAEGLLVPWAEELVAEAGGSLSQLTGIGVARGPGAFTGLRVGLATAIGLALSLDLPVWGGSSLASRAEAARGLAGERALLTLLDARKGKVYARAERGGEVFAGPADLLPEAALAWVEGGAFLATGEGALAYEDLLIEAGGALTPSPGDCAVDRLAGLAAAGLARGEGGPAVEVAPTYLRPPDAKTLAERRAIAAARERG